MVYNPDIDNRIKAIVEQWPQIVAKKMFGGVGYLQRGHMVCGVHKDFVVLRLGPERAREALKKRDVRPFDITGRPMKGWVMVSQRGIRDRATLRAWLEQAREFVETLPPK